MVQKYLLVKNTKKQESVGVWRKYFCFSWDQIHSQVIIWVFSNLEDWMTSVVKILNFWGRKILEDVKTTCAHELA